MRHFRGMLAVVVMCALVGTVRTDEEKVPLDKLPRAVSAAVKKRFPAAEVVSASKETEDGKTVFEVAIKDKGQKMDVSLTPEGAITEIEKTIAETDLPKAAAAALKNKYAGATYKTIEAIIHVKDGKETLDYYEVLLTTADKKKWEVCVTAAGEIKKTEDKSKEKD
jgi:uncharacterized membrane protein YkoI